MLRCGRAACVLAALLLSPSSGKRHGVVDFSDIKREDAGAEAWSWSDTGLGAQVSVLLSSADGFLASAGMGRHLAAAKRVNLAAGLESLGFSVELRFKRHLLRHILHRAVHADGTQAAPSKAAVNGSEVGREEEVLQSMGDSTCNEEDNKRLIKDLGIQAYEGSVQHTRYQAALRNYCVLETAAAAEAKDSSRGVDLSKLVKSPDIQPAGRPRTTMELQTWSPKTVEEKRLWYKQRVLKRMGWASTKPRQQTKSAIVKVRSQYMQMMAISVKVGQLLDTVRKAREHDWMDVVKQKDRSRILAKIKSAPSEVLNWLSTYLARIASNVKSFFTNLWDSFMRLLERGERRCTAKEADLQEREAKGLLKPTDRNNPKAVEGFVRKVRGMSEKGRLDREAAKLEEAMDNVAEANSGTETEEHLMSEVGAVKKEQEKIEEIMVGIGTQPDAHPEALLKEMDAADMRAEKVEDNWCQVTNKNAMESFRAAFDKVLNSIRAAVEAPLPTLGIRGVGVAAGGGGGGFEEVVDFRNLEIGQFKWGSAAYGTSSTGASLGGYVGLGWKGYKENWTLEEGYQTGLFVSQGLSLNFMALPIGFGVTLATDADNSQPGPWIPEPHGINGVLFGYSFSLSLVNLIVPLSYDVGAAYYWLINTECYASLWEFLQYIWLPSCRTYQEEGSRGGCYAGPEQDRIAELRQFIRTPSPVIPDLAFTLLATLYNAVRDPAYTPRCSDSANDFRNNITYFAMKTGKLIYETVNALQGLDTEVAMLDSSMSMAQEFNGGIEETPEFIKWKQQFAKVASTCSQTPPDVVGSVTSRVSLRNLAREQLEELCTEMELSGECQKDGRRGKEYRVQRLALALELHNGAGSRHELDLLASILNSVDKSDAKVMSVTRGLKQMFKGCNRGFQDNCVTGTPVWRLLTKLGSPMLIRVCDSLKADCQRRRFYSRLMFGAIDNIGGLKYYDDEMMAMIITNTMGIGTVDQANEHHPFGSCTEDRNCPVLNSHCPRVKDSHEGETRQCQCKPNFCYRFNNQTMKPYCLAQDVSMPTLLRELGTQYRQYKLQIGHIVGQLSGSGEE